MRGELGGFNQNQVREILQMFRDEIIKKIYGVRGRRRMEV